MVLALSCFYYSYSNAQDIKASQNLINSSGWQGCLTQHTGMIWGGTTGGPCPVQRSADEAILFSYGGSVLYQNIAVNQALSGTGIQVRGWQYSWTIKNANAGATQSVAYDPLTIRVSLYDSTNLNMVETKTYDYSRRIDNWTRFTGSEDFKNPYSLSGLGNLSVSLSSRDDGNWKGYYGPEIQQIDLRLKYSVDACGSNPLASPTCEGYQQAYLQQQCALNPLYSQSCPGWQQAWFTQQCLANPLFGPNCPGYATAYLQQQCALNPLHSPTCPGYEQAYLAQQCTSNQLFSQACPEYQQAYFQQQCKANPLYSSGCPGYAGAFKEKQVTDACKSNPQSSPQCANYLSPTTSTSQPAVLAEPVLVDNPQAQQAISAPSLTNPTSTTSQSLTTPQLGSGLVVPGFTPQPSPQQQRRAQAAKAAQVERASRDPQQQQQAQQVAQMGTVPGFDQYSQAKLPDAVFYQTKEIYRNRTLPDNQRAQRALSQRSDRLHQEMIDEQYRR